MYFHSRINTLVLTIGLFFTLSPLTLQAQSNVSLYGVIDVGVEYINYASQGGSIVRMPTLSSSVPSRLGIRGSESLGNGLEAVFVLENGFAPDQGGLLQGGRLFGRQSTFGLRGSWGKIDVGRQWTTTFHAIVDADVIGPSAFSLASLDSYLPNARVDNSLSYYGAFGGLIVGGVYSIGRDHSPAGKCGGEKGNRACNAWSALVKYNGDHWGVAGAYEEIRGGAGAHPITVVPGAPGVVFDHSGDKDRRYHLNGHVRVGEIRIGGGWLYRNIDTDARSLHTSLYYLGVSMPVPAVHNMSLDAQLSHMDNPSFDSKPTLVVLRANYAFSKRTTAYLSSGYIRNRGHGSAYSVSASSLTIEAPASGQNQFGFLIGLRHAF